MALSWNLRLGIRTEYLPMQVTLDLLQSSKPAHGVQGYGGELISPVFTYTFCFLLRLSQTVPSDLSDIELILEQ
jgi:hypothetical protein